MPAVNYRLMYDAAGRAGMRGDNEIVLWPALMDWRNQTLTPNPDVTYMLTFHDTSAGPVVLEVPPADDGTINGSVMNCWQAPIEDVGPAGVDEGRGGRYLILPPGFDGEVPNELIPLPCDTVRGYGLLRSIPAGSSDRDLAAAVDYALHVPADAPVTQYWSATPTTARHTRFSARCPGPAARRRAPTLSPTATDRSTSFSALRPLTGTPATGSRRSQSRVSRSSSGSTAPNPRSSTRPGGSRTLASHRAAVTLPL